MSSKMQFQVFYGEYNVMYGPNGVDLSAFKRTSSGIDKPLERSFGSICKWLQRGFRVDPLTHVITVQSLINWEVERVFLRPPSVNERRQEGSVKLNRPNLDKTAQSQ